MALDKIRPEGLERPDGLERLNSLFYIFTPFSYEENIPNNRILDRPGIFISSVCESV